MLMIMIKDTGEEYPAPKLNSVVIITFSYFQLKTTNYQDQLSLYSYPYCRVKLKRASSARNNFKKREKEEKALRLKAIEFG